MFYYRVTTTTTTDGVRARRKIEYLEFLRTADLGEHVAFLATSRPRSIVVHPIKQATYIAKTRGAE